MFGFVGEMFSNGFKKTANRAERFTHYRGDRIVQFWTKNNRPLKMLGFMTGSFVVYASAVSIRRKFDNESITSLSSQSDAWLAREYQQTVGPRLQQAIETAFFYAQNGNISLLDPHLDVIAEIIIENPAYKKFIKYDQPMRFAMDTYFDVEHGGMTDDDNSSGDVLSVSTSKSEKVAPQSESQSNTESTVKLSMDSKDLQKQQLVQKVDEQGNVREIEFSNQLDYIRHLCVVRRCEKVYHRALRHAQKGNVTQCAQILAELWEYAENYDYPVMIADLAHHKHDQPWRLTPNELHAIMRLCHSQYAKYLIEAGQRVGEKVDLQGMNKMRMDEVNQKLLHLVHDNLEKARVYAEKFGVLNEDIQMLLNKVWMEKKNYNIQQV